MPNTCENKMQVTGDVPVVKEFLSTLIKHVYIPETEYGDITDIEDVDMPVVHYFDSGWKFPLVDFKAVTESMSTTESLYVRVISDEMVNEYCAQHIFDGGKWKEK